MKFVWGLVSTACKQTVGFAYGLRTLAKHATPQGLTPTVGTNHGHWENFRRKHVTMAKTWSCVFLVDSLFWLHFLVHTDKLVKGQHTIKVILTKRKFVANWSQNIWQFPGNCVCVCMAQLFAKVLQMLMVWLVWPEIDVPPVYSDQTWPQHKVKNIKLGIRPAFRP